MRCTRCSRGEAVDFGLCFQCLTAGLGSGYQGRPTTMPPSSRPGSPRDLVQKDADPDMDCEPNLRFRHIPREVD